MHHPVICAVALCALIAWPAIQAVDRTGIGARVQTLTRDADWKHIASVPVGFPTHHPQGMVRIGETYFVSSVEIKVRTQRLPQPVDGYDRTTGDGTGHLFKIDKAGNLLADLELGEGAIYHPGGIDYDGTSIWVPVAEYRPNSRAIVYRIDPATMRATEVFRFRDHVGAVVHNTDDRTLHGVSWGSRRFYRWTLNDRGRVTNADVSPEQLAVLNPSHYIDYQDCQYAGAGRMLCAGIADIRNAPGAAPLGLGGIELVNLGDHRPIHQVPVFLWTPRGRPMTQNPVWLETGGNGMRAWFMPEDDTSTIYIYDVASPVAHRYNRP